MMLKAPVFSRDGKKIGELALPEAIFGVRPKRHVLWEVVRAYLSNRRIGTAKAKTRAEVKGSGQKIWPQKGTGRARHGNRKAPIFVGGGKAFPPRPRDYGYDPPRKVKRLALKMAFSDRARENRILILDSIPDEVPPKTKNAVELLKNLGLDGEKVLFVTHGIKRNFYLSTRNIPMVNTKSDAEANTYDVLNSEYVVLEKDAIDGLQERLA